MFSWFKRKRGMISLGDAESILNNAESFTIPDMKKVGEYLDAFEVVLKGKKVDDIFKVVKYMTDESANGLVYIVELKKSKSKFSKLLIKVQKSQLSDPASYEYYVGLTLNTLRGLNISNFGLVYGRFTCGFNPYHSGKLCDKKYMNRTNILYEYITSLSGKTVSLYDYINSETIEKNFRNKTVNLINIMVMLLISIQKAQDMLKFTHYDLHLGNVLLVELNTTYNFVCEYRGKRYNLVLNYFPFIIDYGRTHVDPEMTGKVASRIYDSDKMKEYSDFRTYQYEIWKNANFAITKNESKYAYNAIIRRINNVLRREDYMENVKRVLKTDFNMDVKGEVSVELLLEKFYKDENGELSYNIRPWKFNESFDHCKLMNHVCNDMYDQDLEGVVWGNLLKKLDDSFPFVIPGNYGILKYHKFVSDDFKRPIDVVKYLYIDVKGGFGSKIKYDKLYFSQIGGDDSERIYGELFNKMKEKWA